MPETWFPGAIRDPGLNAGYRRGRTLNTHDVAHFTVGRDSRALIRNKGLAAFLFPKSGPPIQFCEVNSITSHACESNDDGCGYEAERMGWHEPLTPDQTRWIGEVVRWRNREWGVPLAHHGGARLPIGHGFRGVVNHGSLVHKACDQHTDGWTVEEWTAAVGSAPSPAPSVPQEDDTMLVHTIGAETHYSISESSWRQLHPLEVLVLAQGGAKFVDLTPEATQVLQRIADENYQKLHAGPLATLVAWIAKLFPKKAERAGSV